MFKLLRGKAKDAFEDVEVETMAQEGYDKEMFKVLDGLHPLKKAREQKVDAFDGVFHPKTDSTLGRRLRWA